MKIIVLVSGGFDPLHSGHINYFKEAAKLGDKLIVGINSDAWLTRKKGKPFMSSEERNIVISNLIMVDDVYSFTEEDDADGSCINFIQKVLDEYPDDKIIFANGGDRTVFNIPEMDAFRDISRLSFMFGVGGEYKQNSSSDILNNWSTAKTYRQWGYYKVLYKKDNHLKVKELVVEPGKSLSYQRHHERSEYWIVAEGVATVHLENTDQGKFTELLEKNDELTIPVKTWHQLVNNTNKEIKIIEIQYGTNCTEEDIQRI